MNELEINLFAHPIFKHYGFAAEFEGVMVGQVDRWLDYYASQGFGGHPDLARLFRDKFIESAKIIRQPVQIFSLFCAFVKENGTLKEQYIQAKLLEKSDCQTCRGMGGFMAPVVNSKTGEERECFFSCQCDRGRLMYGGALPHNQATDAMMRWKREQDAIEAENAREYVKGLGIDPDRPHTFGDLWRALNKNLGPIGQNVENRAKTPLPATPEIKTPVPTFIPDKPAQGDLRPLQPSASDLAEIESW